ncbi:LysR family transcriptional regulator [Xanthobacter autotrophicus]|uniref:LysR family transcriptional regulator n=2 Tax=Xanthobacter autotrophicus TaxID=280 RepID=A0A6C1KNJ2_XANAU|nr:LysR family transcriptional regulator [Xanthobacter autotrophicus]
MPLLKWRTFPMSNNSTEIEIRYLKYLIAASEYGSFRKAAAALGVQESSVSRRIRDIEDQVGASLFLRHPGGINLTIAGQRFLHRVRHALDHIRDAAAEVAAIGRAEDGYVKVGLFSSLSSGFLSDLFREYDAKYGSVHIDFVDGEAHDHINSIRKFQLDIAFVIGLGDWPECDTTYLWSEQVLVALPEGHPLSTEDALTWRDLSSEKILIRDTAAGMRIQDYVIRKIREVECEPRVEAQRVGRYKLLNLVASGRGITLVIESENLVKVPGVIYRSLRGEVLQFYAAWSPKNDNPAFRTLLSLARSMARSSAPQTSSPVQDLDGVLAEPSRKRDLSR